MTKKTKKIIAREFLFLLGTTIIYIGIIFIWKNLIDKNKDRENILKQKIEEIREDSTQNQYYYNNVIYLASELYEIFGESLESKVQEQKIIKRTAVDILLDDFFGKYKNEKLTLLKRNQIKSNYNDNFDSLIKNLYSENLNEKIKTEKIQLIKEVYRLESHSDNKSDFFIKFIPLKKELNRIQSSFLNVELNSDKIFELGIILFSIFFIFRYLLYGMKWSIKTLKE